MTGILRLVMVAFTLFAVALIYLSAPRGGTAALSSTVGFLASALLLTSACSWAQLRSGFMGTGVHQEALARRIKTEPLAHSGSGATVTCPTQPPHVRSCRRSRYVDAHVLKWRPIGTLSDSRPSMSSDRISDAIRR